MPLILQSDGGGGASSSPVAGGYYTYDNTGHMIWVPYASTPTVTTPTPTTVPFQTGYNLTIPQTNVLREDAGLPPITNLPPPPASPSQNAGMPANAATPPMTDYIPKPPTSNGYIPGKPPTQAELDAIVADLRAHADDMWTYEGAIEAGITPKDAARIKGQIPFAEIMANDLPKHDSYNYTPTTQEATTPNEGITLPQESDELIIEQPELPSITWEEKYHVEGAPDWWRGMIPSRYDPQSEYAAMLNSMIPFMSPEDQRYTASVLYRLYPKFFASYSSFAANETIPQAPTDLSTQQRQYMGSYQRAQAILDTLEKVKQVSGNPKLGPGYAYVKELGSVLRDYSSRNAGNSQTRQQYQQMMGALDPLMAEGQQENLSAFSALTRMLTQPYYTAGQVHPTTTLQDNSVISGTPIKNYF